MIPVASSQTTSQTRRSMATKSASGIGGAAADIFGYFTALEDIKDIASTDIATINQQLNNQLSTMAIKFRSVGSSQVNAEATNGFSILSQSFLKIQSDSLNEFEREQTQLKETAAAEIASIRAREDASEDEATSGLISGLATAAVIAIALA